MTRTAEILKITKRLAQFSNDPNYFYFYEYACREYDTKHRGDILNDTQINYSPSGIKLHIEKNQ